MRGNCEGSLMNGVLILILPLMTNFLVLYCIYRFMFICRSLILLSEMHSIYHVF